MRSDQDASVLSWCQQWRGRSCRPRTLDVAAAQRRWCPVKTVCSRDDAVPRCWRSAAQATSARPLPAAAPTRRPRRRPRRRPPTGGRGAWTAASRTGGGRLGVAGRRPVGVGRPRAPSDTTTRAAGTTRPASLTTCSAFWPGPTAPRWTLSRSDLHNTANRYHVTRGPIFKTS